MFDLITKAFAGLISFFFKVTNSYAVSIILLTLVVRFLVFPLTAKQTRSMQAMQKLQPQVKQLQAQYKDDRLKLNEELMGLYREHKVNPAAGCLPLLIQAPLLFFLYRVIQGLTASRPLEWLMIRVPRPRYLSEDSELYRALVRSGGRMISWGIDLSQSARSAKGFDKAWPYYLLVGLVAVTGVLQQRQASARVSTTNNPQAQQMQTILKIMPIFFAFISFSLQAAMVLYWIVGNIFTMIQQTLIFRTMPKDTAPNSPPLDVSSKVKAAAAVGKPETNAKGGAAGKGGQKPSAGKGAGQKAIESKTPSVTKSGTEVAAKPGGILARAREAAALEAQARAKRAAEKEEPTSNGSTGRAGTGKASSNGGADKQGAGTNRPQGGKKRKGR